MKPSNIEVQRALPQAPDGYYYTVESISPMVTRVWLNHIKEYIYSDGPVRTVYCFLKNDKVHAPKNRDKMQPKSVCSINDLSTKGAYSVIVPVGPKSLHHLK